MWLLQNPSSFHCGPLPFLSISSKFAWMGQFTGGFKQWERENECDGSTTLPYGLGLETVHSTGENIATWSHLTAKEAEKGSLAWQLYASLHFYYHWIVSHLHYIS